MRKHEETGQQVRSKSALFRLYVKYVFWVKYPRKNGDKKGKEKKAGSAD